MTENQEFYEKIKLSEIEFEELSARVLLEAADVLDKKDWTQMVWARNAQNAMCSAWSPDATKFCASGAIARILASDDSSAFLECVNVVERYLDNGKTLYAWNDELTRTKQEVVDALRNAGLSQKKRREERNASG